MIQYSKKSPKVKHVIFDVPDRMTRNDIDKIKIYTLIKEHDKKIHFSRSNKTIDKNSKSDEEFVLDIEIAVAKKYSNDISMKASMGMLEKAEQGIYPAHAPLGYINNNVTRQIEIDKEKAPFVKEAFSLMSTGEYSLSMIVDILYDKGLRGSRRKGKYAKSRLHVALTNPIYCGYFNWKGKLYKGIHEPIISQELFDDV